MSTAERLACLDRAARPSLANGAVLNDGRFVRSLKNEEAPKRFDLDGEPPAFGYRVKPHEWRWDSQEVDDGLSVNLETCVGTLRCAILLHPKPDAFRHVVVIDLALLSRELGIRIDAVYDPDPENAPNPCHFNLVPIGKTVKDLKMAIKDWHRAVFAQQRKPPKSKPDADKAAHEHARYARVFEIHRDIHDPEASPARTTTTDDEGGRPELW